MRRVGQNVAGALARPEILRMAKAKAVLRHWPEIVGEGLAERSRPDRFANGVVWVAVKGSTWAQELRMRRETILARLAELAGDPRLFVDIRFGVRPLRGDLSRSDLEPEPAPKPDSSPYRGLTIREIADRRLANWPLSEGP